MGINSSETLQEASRSLERVQAFSADDLIRKQDLGKYAFDDAVEPASRLIDLAKSLPVGYLNYFPDTQLGAIRSVCDGIFSLFQSFIDFDVASAQPSVDVSQEQLIDSLSRQYQHAFDVLYPLVAYSTARSQDYSELERSARSATQVAQDQADELVRSLNEKKSAVDTIIAEVRTAAAEQGVSKQAIHFKNEADHHNTLSATWLQYSAWTAIGLGLFAILSLFLHKFPYLSPTNAYETTQLAVSKVLIFAVISYMLLLCARNFMSHKHNEVVNRHRQNALATFTALAEAASEQASADIILTHAASCIFSPQETGYAKQDGGHGDAPSSLQLLAKIQQPPAAVG
jgi:hypothetical protein